MHRIIAPTMIALAFSVAAPISVHTASAQDAVLAKLYGNGVHAYFAGDYVDAHKYLTAAVDAGTRDPRVYYYRGLAYLKLGRDEMAAEDFQIGADLEMQDVNNFYPVAPALARVQGSQRMMVEDTRTEARLANYTKAVAARKARFGDNATGEEPLPPGNFDPGDVAPVDPSDELFDEPQDPAPAGGADPGIADPFGEPAGEPAEPAPMEQPMTDPADPFGGGEPAEPPMTDPADPFGGGPAGEPADPGVADPFGGGAPAEPADPGVADPFGGGAPMPEPGGGADPFGGDAADPFGGAPAGGAPADGGEADPFGGGAPGLDDAPQPMDDPFAAPVPEVTPAPGDAPAGGEPAAGADKVDSKALPGKIGKAIFGGIFGGGGVTPEEEQRAVDQFELDQGAAGPDVPPGEVIPGAGGVVEGGLGDPFGDDPVDPGQDAVGGDAPDPFGGNDDAGAGAADPFGDDGGAAADPFGDDGEAAPADDGQDPFGAANPF